MSKRIIVACGGTGGHTFPGLAVAQELRQRGHEVVVWNSGRSIEKSVMRSWDGQTFATGAKQLAAKNIFANVMSIFRCCRELKRFKPDALLAMGSYSSLPPVLAARWRGIPVALHEANTIPGRAVEVLSRYAKVVGISFEVTAKYLPKCRTELTGLPVRSGIVGQPRFNDVPRTAFTIFVTGGSQGAHRVNELVMQAMPIVKRELDRRGEGANLYVIHQTGAADEESVKECYAANGISARVNAFEREMGRAFSTANYVVCRAGASTCFELASVGRSCLFIPLPGAIKNHQHFNADAFVRAGAAAEAIQDQITPRALANNIIFQYDNPAKRADAEAKMKALAIPDAASRVAALVESLCGGGR